MLKDGGGGGGGPGETGLEQPRGPSAASPAANQRKTRPDHTVGSIPATLRYGQDARRRGGSDAGQGLHRTSLLGHFDREVSPIVVHAAVVDAKEQRSVRGHDHRAL